MPAATFRIRPRLFLAALVLTTSVACQDTSSVPANQPPTAAFIASTAAGPAPLVVAFDATGSSDPDGTIVNYAWTFGDGASGSGALAQHTYVNPGGYTARLTVTDDRGATGSAFLEIAVGSGSSSGSVSGRITVGASAAAATRQALPLGAALAAPAARTWGGRGDANVVPGELIVKFVPGVRRQQAAPLSVDGVRLDHVGPLAVADAQLFRHPGLGRGETIALAMQLQTRSDVLYAQPNYILQPMVVPDDEHYAYQWHYPAINLPQAWDVTTGSPDIVVAVGDSGILYAAGNAAASHPDFTGKILPGYDFISNPSMAGDGGGRDPDPYDVGDVPGGQSSYHGTHVAGTIAAATNNGVGVAGVDWQAMIVPVRMLGIGGGSLVDIVEGTLWAAGFAIPGVPANANPAHVINLSLGGAYACTPFEQDAFDRIANDSPRRTIVVVAAGNEDQDAADFSPASCRNVITVGGTEFRGHRAPYSNFGTRIDVMAPGGDVTVDRNGDGFADGVLSTFAFDGPEGGFGFEFQQGTSMAAPHVAGVVSLMKSLEPALRPAEALALLRETARPLSAASCGRASGSDCGAGLIDAAAALTLLAAGTIPTPGGGVLAISPNPLDFGTSHDEMTVTLRNTGGATVSWEIEAYVPSPQNPGDMLSGSVYLPAGAPASGQLAAGATASTAIGVDRERATADGLYGFTLVFDVDGSEYGVDGRFRVGGEALPQPRGPMTVFAFQFDDDDELVLSGLQEAQGVIVDYAFELEAGDNILVAWADENDNLDIDGGDFIGIYPEFVRVAAGESVAGIDFVIERVIEVGASVVLPDGSSIDGGSWRELVAPSVTGADERTPTFVPTP